MRKKEEQTPDFTIDDSAINQVERIAVPKSTESENEDTPNRVVRLNEERDNLVNCLRNEKVFVRFIIKPRGMFTDPKHVLFGGMSNNAKVFYTTPLLKSGMYADVLTKDEKKYLEYALGLEPNALSVHKKTNNFWDDSNDFGIGRIELHKGDNPFDLSNPMDYIRYKVLLRNSDDIAPSMQVLQDSPKATYKFVIINENDSAKAYMEFGKINEDKEKLRVIIETIDGRPTAANSKLEYLQGKVGDLLEANTKMFLTVVTDPLLDNKVLIKKAIEAGIISNRGGYLYNKADKSPLCESNQEPTLNIAAKYLSLPKNQELKFSIEAKLKE